MLIRPFLLISLLILLTDELQFDAIRELFGQSHRTMRPTMLNFNSSALKENSPKQYLINLYKIFRFFEKSTTYIQCRRFHPDQFARDIRDLEFMSISASPLSSLYSQFSYGGSTMNFVGSSREACRLTSNSCLADYQCCSGKCRCTRWSITGQFSCLKKCF